MKVFYLILSFVAFPITQLSAQNCFKQLENAFNKRGAYTVSDDMHRHVIISFFTPNDTTCVSGKVRVENGTITSVFVEYQDNTFELMEQKFFNAKKQFPAVTNGLSELVYTADGEKFRVVFIDKLKPKAKEPKKAELPSDL